MNACEWLAQQSNMAASCFPDKMVFFVFCLCYAYFNSLSYGFLYCLMVQYCFVFSVMLPGLYLS